MAAKNGHLPAATLEQIRAAKDVAKIVTVDVPDWGVSVKVRGLTRGEFKRMLDEVELIEKESEKGERMDVLTLTTCLVDPVLSEAEATEILAGKGLNACKVLLAGCMEASGLTDGFQEG